MKKCFISLENDEGGHTLYDVQQPIYDYIHYLENYIRNIDVCKSDKICHERFATNNKNSFFDCSLGMPWVKK